MLIFLAKVTVLHAQEPRGGLILDSCTAASYYFVVTLLTYIYLQEPKGAYSELNPADAGMEVLEVRNLLEFARQIAAGMV